MDEAPQAPPTERLVKVFIKMRDKRAEIKRAYEEEDKKIEDQMDAVKKALLEVCKAAGADSIRTGAGTISRTVKTRYWTSDWEAMHAFVKEHDALGLLERRVAQTAMKEFLQTHPDLMPKGMNVNSEYDVIIRRS
jgi:phage host-nuclease inhibitor protein Gam